MPQEYEPGWCPICGLPEQVCGGVCVTEMEEEGEGVCQDCLRNYRDCRCQGF